MPFTLSHPAAVLPLRRLAIPFSALVIGSMTPDFPYFLLTGTNFHHVGHHLPGSLLFNLPAGLLVYVVWHRILKKPLTALLPTHHRRRLAPLALQPVSLRRASDWLLPALGILIGVATHLLWDSFTHKQGEMVLRLPLLQAQLLPERIPVIHNLRVYNALQYLSGAFGLAVLALAYVRWYRAQEPLTFDILPPTSMRTRRRLVLLLLVGAPLIGIGYSQAVYYHYPAIDYTKKRVADAVEAAMTAGAILLTLFALVWNRRRTDFENLNPS